MKSLDLWSLYLIMLITQSDPENTLTKVGEFLAYHNRLRLLANLKYRTKDGKGLNRCPIYLQSRLTAVRKVREKLCHDPWEIIHSQIFSVNEGCPNWKLSKANLEEYIIEVRDSLANEIIKL